MTFTIEDMKNRFQKFGTIYTPDDVKEEVHDIIGLEEKKDLMNDFFMSLKKYIDIAPQLKEAKITPNFTMLLYGPPGTGKTALTRAMAKKHNIPVGLVEADRLVSPLLGDTVKNIRGVFDLAVEFAKDNGVFLLFFDEIDAVTSERANAHEVGEIKRAVISFLQIIDKISYENIPLAIFGATNHKDQLDSAVWRRFTYHLSFPFPNYIIRKDIILSFVDRVKSASIAIDKTINDSLKTEFELLNNIYNQKKLKLKRDLNDKELYAIVNKLEKSGDNGLLCYTFGFTGADLMRAMRVSLIKAIKKSILTYDDYFHSLKVCGGTRDHVIHSLQMAEPTSNRKNENNEEIDLDEISKLDIDL